MDKKKEKTIRLNSRVRTDQFKYIKALANKKNSGDAETLRLIIDYYIEKHK